MVNIKTYHLKITSENNDIKCFGFYEQYCILELKIIKKKISIETSPNMA